jgi:hypothetical protein
MNQLSSREFITYFVFLGVRLKHLLTNYLPTINNNMYLLIDQSLLKPTPFPQSPKRMINFSSHSSFKCKGRFF